MAVARCVVASDRAVRVPQVDLELIAPKFLVLWLTSVGAQYGAAASHHLIFFLVAALVPCP